MLKIIHILTQWSCRTLMIKIQDIFANRNTPSWSEEVFVVKKVKNTVPQTYVINDLNGDEIIGAFC